MFGHVAGGRFEALQASKKQNPFERSFGIDIIVLYTQLWYILLFPRSLFLVRLLCFLGFGRPDDPDSMG